MGDGYMKIYAKSIWWTGSISLISLILLLNLPELKRLYDISLAIFGSSLISLIISIIGYRCERKKTLENFFNVVYKKMAYLSHYIEGWSMKKSVTFLLIF